VRQLLTEALLLAALGGVLGLMFPAHSAYVSGDVTSWVKIKNPDYSQAVGRWEKFQRKGTARESAPILQRASTA
jgi:hypothetical protein